jgi:hypothetical protein
MLPTTKGILMTTTKTICALFLAGFLTASGAPVEDQVSAENAYLENGILFANGKASFRDALVTLRCERLQYERATAQVRCFGATQAVINGVKIELSDVTYDSKVKQITQGIVEKEK